MSATGGTEAASIATRREPELLGQTVVIIGGSAGIGLETARRARREGAEVVLTGRNAERLAQAAHDVGPRSTAAFDVDDLPALTRFFDGLPAPIDHVLVTGPGPTYAPLLEMTGDQVRRAVGDHLALGLEVARNAAPKIRPGGTLLLMGGTGGRKISRERSIALAALQTSDGDVLYVQSRGVRHGSPDVLARLARGEDVDASEYTFRTATQIETAAAGLEWLNKAVFVSVGGRGPGGVVYETYLVGWARRSRSSPGRPRGSPASPAIEKMVGGQAAGPLRASTRLKGLARCALTSHRAARSRTTSCRITRTSPAGSVSCRATIP
jgi:NAD(P)-dependent dehydrogenase (short-subunit alcohol dehydrogenase family)